LECAGVGGDDVTPDSLVLQEDVNMNILTKADREKIMVDFQI
jgi:hypothetical protein